MITTGKVDWYDKSIFMVYDMPSYILVDMGYLHRLKVYESETIIYIDDTATGTNRQATPYVVRVWSENPHGTPPYTPIVYTVYVDVYDTNNVLKERHTLKYMYVRSFYTVNFVDENDRALEMLTYVVIYRQDGVYYYKYYGSTIRIPDYGGYNLILEASRDKDGKKYYFVKRNPELYSVTKIKVTPNNKYIVGIRIKVSELNIPVIQDIYNYFMWLFAKGFNFSLYMANVISNLLNIKVPVIKAEYDINNQELTIYYEVDPVKLVVLAIIAAGLIGGAAIAWSIRDIFIANVKYQITEVTQQSYREYLQTIRKLTDYAQENNLTAEQTQALLDKLTPPLVSSEIGNVIQQKDSLIEQLKTLLIVGIGGAALITFLMMAARK